MRAAEENDFTTVRQRGWMPVFEALQAWWAMRFALIDMRAYFDSIGDERPDAVYAAVRELRGEEWRPKPSALYRAVSGRSARASERASKERAARGEKPRADQAPEALARVRALVEGGARVCECIGSKHYLIEELDGGAWDESEFRRWQTENRRKRSMEKPATPLPPHVMRCRECRGIEQGQVYAALDDAPDLEVPAA